MVRLRVVVSLLLILGISNYAARKRFAGYEFESYVISDVGYRYFETVKSNGTYIEVQRDRSYSLVINNPLPVRVAVAVSIDGLNVIDGKRTTPSKARKWIIRPYSSITLRGWQTGPSALRRFVFTDKEESYAQWKEHRDNKNYSRNLGVIGIAYFWSSAELYGRLRPPTPFSHRRYERTPYDAMKEERRAAAREETRLRYKESSDIQALKKSKRSPARAQAPAATKSRNESDDEGFEDENAKAGTGMGYRERNNVVDVEFHYDTGMYRENDVVTIYYEFARATSLPSPFDDCGVRGKFAPEMP